VYFGKGDEGALKAIANAGLEVSSWDDFFASGAGVEVKVVPPKADDVCCIMYTRCAGQRGEGVAAGHLLLASYISRQAAVC
jgi:hypothetical protein